jgi:hypothetical protein
LYLRRKRQILQLLLSVARPSAADDFWTNELFFLQVEHRPVLPKSASWEPESSVTQLKRVNAMTA